LIKYSIRKNSFKYTSLLTLPFDDFIAALGTCIQKFSIVSAIVLILAFIVSWWAYVPVHELGHAFGCLLGSGTVTRLEIAPMYGASLLKNIFPFVSTGSDYAGQLTGFDTHGSDLTYLFTVFFPFILTILLGVPLIKYSASLTSHPIISCLILGFAIPIAYAPFISITGDYYEMGSIIISRFKAVWSPGFELERWRSDDLIKLVKELFFKTNSIRIVDIIGVTASFLFGLVLSFITYWTGALWSRILLRT
jgi:hypothetical protein